jgi:hypothetical protein
VHTVPQILFWKIVAVHVVLRVGQPRRVGGGKRKEKVAEAKERHIEVINSIQARTVPATACAASEEYSLSETEPTIV